MYYNFYEQDGWQKVPKHCGIRSEDYKLIKFYGSQPDNNCLDDDQGWELYDLRVNERSYDPTEINNVFDHSEYRTIFSNMKSQLKTLHGKYGIRDID